MNTNVGVTLRVTTESNPGSRTRMDEIHCIGYHPNPSCVEDNLYGYFAMLDGHGGPEAANFVKNKLLDFIVSQNNFWSDDEDSVLKAIKDGFINTHYAMVKEFEGWPKTKAGLPSMSGTTASIVFIKQGKLFIGHVGDSRIVLGLESAPGCDWNGQTLTTDHKADYDEERNRIIKSGGAVIRHCGAARVVWNRPRIELRGNVDETTPTDAVPYLAVARSLGDFWSYNSVQNEFAVSPIPDVFVMTLNPAFHRCLIIASDGLWNVMRSHEAVDIVHAAERVNEYVRSSSSEEELEWVNPSKQLINRALDKWGICSADNVSVITIVFDHPNSKANTEAKV